MSFQLLQLVRHASCLPDLHASFKSDAVIFFQSAAMTSDIKRHSTNPTFASTVMRFNSELDTALSPAHHIDTAVGSLAVRDSAAGESGETIVLWPSILADHHIYQGPIASWWGKHRLVIIDGPGHGDSGPAPTPFTIKQCGQALADILNQLGVSTPVILVGCSWGGFSRW